MSDIDWDALSLDELKDIQKKAIKAIEGYTTRKRKEALAAAEAAAAELGYSLNDLMDGAKASKPKAPPKYAHPENAAKTWSGRGRQPGWVKEHVDGGGSLDDLLIAT